MHWPQVQVHLGDLIKGGEAVADVAGGDVAADAVGGEALLIAMAFDAPPGSIEAYSF